MQIIESISADAASMSALRREIHAHPAIQVRCPLDECFGDPMRSVFFLEAELLRKAWTEA